MKRSSVLFLVMSVAAPSICAAQDEQIPTGYYVEASLWDKPLEPTDEFAKFDFETDFQDIDPSIIALTSGLGNNPSRRINLDTGFDFGRFANLAAGYAFGNALRVEAEVSYLQHDVDVFRSFSLDNQDLEEEGLLQFAMPQGEGFGVDVSGSVAEGRGTVETKATFANGFYDMPFGGRNLSPYLGAGVGMAQVRVDYRAETPTPMQMDDTVLAFQVMAGASYQLGREIDVVFGARYRGMGEASVSQELLPPAFSLEGEGFVGEFGLRRDF